MSVRPCVYVHSMQMIMKGDGPCIKARARITMLGMLTIAGMSNISGEDGQSQSQSQSQVQVCR
jgi:hypothetical protein